ncbi:MAG: ABC transporter substrate-binding protein [Candidatus Lustribacter sp.]
MTRLFVRALSLLVCLGLATAPAGAQTPVEVSLAMNAPGSGNWPVYIALAQNFFAGEGLHVTTVMSGSNVATMNLVATGSANFALDGSDIEIESVAHDLPVMIIAPEFGPNPYTVLTAAGITSWQQLKGKTIALGSPQDVSSLSFLKMAAQQHLGRDDFSIFTSASSSSRYDALLSGQVAATVLSQPFDIQAEEHGFHPLATGSATLKPWADTSIAVNSKWAAANRAAVVHFVRALKAAVRFGYTHKAEAVAALVATTNIAVSTAQKAYDYDFTQLHVFTINDRFDFRRDLLAMGDSIRAAGAIATVPPIDAFFDPSYLAGAGR